MIRIHRMSLVSGLSKDGWKMVGNNWIQITIRLESANRVVSEYKKVLEEIPPEKIIHLNGFLSKIEEKMEHNMKLRGEMGLIE